MELIKHILWGWKNTISPDHKMARWVEATDIQIRNMSTLCSLPDYFIYLGKFQAEVTGQKGMLKGLKILKKMNVL